jgi:GT2 family glycosyltransferase
MIQDYVKANSTDWKMIRHETSLGHTKASEAGINDTFCENIFLLNSDTILTKNSLKILEGVLNDNEKIAVVGSTTSSASGVQLNQIANVNRFKWNVKDIEKFALEIEKDKGIEDIDLVNGFCFGIKRSVFSRLEDLIKI